MIQMWENVLPNSLIRMITLNLKGIEDAKISCARKHFEALSTAEVKYEVVDGYAELLAMVKN